MTIPGNDMDQVFADLDQEVEEVQPAAPAPQAPADPQTPPADQGQPADKYHGVSREQAIQQLEAAKADVDKLRQEFTQKFEELKIPPTDKQVTDSVDYLKEIGMTQEQIDQMSGTEIVKMTFQKMEERTDKKINDVLKQRDDSAKSASKQIDDAYDKYPALKPKGTYKDTVKLVLENARLRKQYITLDQACQQVNKILSTDGQSIKTDSNSPAGKVQAKRARATVEGGEGSPVLSGQPDDEETRIHKLLSGGDIGLLGGL